MFCVLGVVLQIILDVDIYIYIHIYFVVWPEILLKVALNTINQPTKPLSERRRCQMWKLGNATLPELRGCFFHLSHVWQIFVKGFDSTFLVNKCVFPIKTDDLHHKHSPSSQHLFFSIIFIAFIWSMVIDTNRFTM